ncbi:Spy/CpxP family protein refolding chaperone [Arcobacter sp. s6]|uniref:Spy/CpxP family protein refolding chaperone n=1 Tax=Arcobacter sp. s6 TaxID=3230363 RepID=UPI0034A08B79
MKILKIFLLLGSLFLFVNADDDDGHHKYKHSYKNLDYLELNNEQTAKIKEILIEFKEQYKEFYEFKEKQEDRLKDILKDDTLNEKEYLTILNEIKSKASLLEVEKMRNIHNILNEKQRKKFSKYFKEWEVE